MKFPLQFFEINAIHNKVLAIIFAISLVFLQEGFSYYLSFQCVGLLLILYITFFCGPVFKNIDVLFLVVFLFTLSICITGFNAPLVLSRASSNILLTLVAIVTYSLIIIALLNVRVNNFSFILNMFRVSSALTICALAFLLIIQDLSLFESISRESFFLQNNRLITNYSSIDALQNEIIGRAKRDILLRIDLTYGEASYLALVIFTCVGCYMLTTKLLTDSTVSPKPETIMPSLISKRYIVVVLLGFLSLLYIRSLSSIIYAGLIFLFYFRIHIFGQLKLVNAFILVVSLLSAVYMFTDIFDYVIHRLTMRDSLSFSQRFGSLFDFGIYEYAFGLKDESMIPEAGFHNGLIYIVAISGLAGISFFTFLIYKVYFLSRLVGMPSFFILLFLAQVVQNGAVFSPNKIVLYAMILLPLSCARSVYYRSAFEPARLTGQKSIEIS
jgi:hypothetical protein